LPLQRHRPLAGVALLYGRIALRPEEIVVLALRGRRRICWTAAAILRSFSFRITLIPYRPAPKYSTTDEMRWSMNPRIASSRLVPLHPVDPVMHHLVGIGFRSGVAWIGLIERTIIRSDVAQAIGTNRPRLGFSIRYKRTGEDVPQDGQAAIGQI